MRDVKKIVLFIILLSNILFGSNKIDFTKEELKYLKEHPVITAHNESGWIPYNYNKNGTPTGYSIDYMKLLAKTINIKVKFITGHTWGEYLEMAKQDKIDVILNIIKTPQREKFLLYTKDYYLKIKDAIFTLDDDYYTSMDDLKGKKLAIIKGFFEVNIIKEHYPDIKIVTTKDSKESFSLLSQGKVDAVIGDTQVGNYIIDNYQYDSIKIGFYAPQKYFESDTYIAVNKSDAILKSILDKGMRSIDIDDIIKLRNRWFTNEYSNKGAFVLTQKEQIYLKHKKVIKMCTNKDWNPIEFVENGVPQGISIDTIKLIEKILHNKVTFKYIPTQSWAQSQEYLRKRICDILPSAVKNEKRLEYANFTKPYMNYKMMIITNNTVPFINSLKVHKDKTLCRKKGSGIINILKKQMPGVNINEVESYKDMFDQVASGKAFASIATLPVSLYYIKRYGYDNLKVSGTLDKVYHLSIAARNDQPELVTILDKALDNISVNQHQKIFNKWTSFKIINKTDYSLIIKVIAFLFLIIAIIIYYNRKLSRAMKLAQESTKLKSDFLANMSHEIRTPMNGIIGMTYLLFQTNLNETQKGYLEKIDSSAKSLLGIINDILDFSKIEAGKLTIDMNNFNLLKTIEHVVAINEFKAHEKGLKLIIDYDNNLSKTVYGDSLRVSQILTNLLSNAIKFTHQGEIVIKATAIDKNRVRLDVKDQGIGLTPEQQSKLFQSFTQADGSITRKYGGTGLGLAISKKLVELMNGKIWVESEVDKGSTFSFEIELEQKDDELDQSNDKLNKDPKELKELITTLKGSKILLTEDNKVNQDIILGLLAHSGIDIDIASDGVEAVEKFKKNSYELILMDLQMPNMDGYEATKIIREQNKDIPIVALTANAMKDDIEKTKKAGMNEHLNKPINVENLYNTLLEYITAKTSKNSTNTIEEDIELPTFETIDIQSALRLVMGNKKIVLNTLKGFLEYKNIKLENLDNDELKRTAHTIKGLSGAIGAKKLQKIAKDIEETQDKKLFELFYNEFYSIINEIEQKIELDSTKKIKASNDDVKILFDELKEALKTKRAKNIKPIIEKIEEYELDDDKKDIFEKIKLLSKKFKFKEALELL